MVNKDSAIPYYLQLAETIRHQITSRKYKPNELIPSERELCEHYHISRSTVRQTVQLLKEEGLVRKEKGVGTRVNEHPKLEQNLLGHHNFDLQMAQTGHEASIVILKHEIITGPGRIQRLMELSVNDQILKIVRLRIVDGDPLFIGKIYMPLTKFPDITSDDFRDTDIFLRRLKADYGTILGDAKVFLEPVLLDDFECETMNVIERPAVGLMIERISYDINSNPIAVTKRVFRGDRCRHMIAINSD